MTLPSSSSHQKLNFNLVKVYLANTDLSKINYSEFNLCGKTKCTKSEKILDKPSKSTLQFSNHISLKTFPLPINS